MKANIVLCALLLVITTSDARERHTGNLNGAHFIIDVPEKPNGDVIFIARGYRPEFFPLSAVYEYDTDFYQSLLEGGYTLASTSFRTNDWIVAEGAKDILTLKEYLTKNLFPIRSAYLYGETMGAGVAVWFAENRPDAMNGVFALGAQLFPDPNVSVSPGDAIAKVFNKNPKIPILFVANKEEIQSSRAYAEAAAESDYPPEVWLINRSGHVNVNSAERLRALQALENWIRVGRPPDSKDATLVVSPESSAAIHQRFAASSIRGIRPLYGNIYTHFVRSDLEALGLSLGESFHFTHKNQSHKIQLAKAYSDVPVGDWVAFFDSEGYLQISRNYANAADTLKAVKGDPLLLSTIP